VEGANGGFFVTYTSPEGFMLTSSEEVIHYLHHTQHNLSREDFDFSQQVTISKNAKILNHDAPLPSHYNLSVKAENHWVGVPSSALWNSSTVANQNHFYSTSSTSSGRTYFPPVATDSDGVPTIHSERQPEFIDLADD